MVPWTHWREPRLGRLLTDLTSEFTVFNLVIRLSNVKQPAFFHVSRRLSPCWTTGRSTGQSPSFSSRHADSWKTSFFNYVRETAAVIVLHDQVQGHALGMVLLPFLYFRWGQPIVHLINELVSCLCPTWVDRLRSCNGSNARTLTVRNWIPFGWFLFLIN